MRLPTDTAALRPVTKQYELFGRRIGNGIVRRQLVLGLLVTAGWVLFLVVLGVPFLTKFSPVLYVAPPFGGTYFATRTDPTGRMTYLSWYDALLARRPSRRRPVVNPALPVAAAALAHRRRARIRVEAEIAATAQAPAPAPAPAPRTVSDEGDLSW